MRSVIRLLASLVLGVLFAGAAVAQGTGAISGTVTDEKNAIIAGATVTARHTETNISRTVQTDEDGRYRFERVPVGRYEVTVEAANFAKHIQTGIELLLNQSAVIDVAMKPGGPEAVVNVVENAAIINTNNAEVSTRFDSRRLSELPLGPTRNVLGVALSAPGVSQLGAGQTGFAAGISYSANGGRVRSNNFMIDGQDNNEPGVSGAAQPLNNPDIVQEVRLITNQFLAEYGRNGSSVFNAITKAGSNDYHGSLYWFYNGNALNACSNTDKKPDFAIRPRPIHREGTHPSESKIKLDLLLAAPCICQGLGRGDLLSSADATARSFLDHISAGATANLGQGPL